MELYHGLAKVQEEMGEVTQVIGKLMAFPEGPHPDRCGDLSTRLVMELADLSAAIEYYLEKNVAGNAELKLVWEERFKRKQRTFASWKMAGIRVG